MTEQVCPHCEREITEKDVASYPKKLLEKELGKEVDRSDICHRLELMYYVIFGVLVLITASPIFFLSLVSYEMVYRYGAISIGVEVVFGIFLIVWVIISNAKLQRSRINYVNSRLLSN